MLESRIMSGQVRLLQPETGEAVALPYISGELPCNNDIHVLNFGMRRPKVITAPNYYCAPCTGKTNTDHNAVMLVSFWAKPDEDKRMRIHKNLGAAVMLAEYIIAAHSFLGYAINGLEVILSARAEHLAGALMNPDISSIVLVGHSDVGVWAANDRFVNTRDVADLVRQAGHCKDGFGFKTGCNTIRQNGEFHVLAPAYGHRAHEGSLYSLVGKPASEDGLLPGSEWTYGLPQRPLLRKFVTGKQSVKA